MRNFDFSGKAFVVTGGRGVLGSEMVVALVEGDANAVIIGRGAELKSELHHRKGTEGGILIHAADILDRQSL